LTKHDGQAVPEEFVKGERFAFIKGTPKLLASPFAFRQHGQSGAQISELLPWTSKLADEIAIIRSMHTTQFNHAPAQIFMNTGHQIVGRPSIGSWLTYGLGSDSSDLPGFVVLLSGENDPDGGKSCWGSGFLPTVHQGVQFRSEGDPVLFLRNPDGVSARARRESLDVIRALNQDHLEAVGEPEIETRIASYEMSYRMQTSVPELMDISREPASIHELYGTEPGRESFANNCLLARRLVERGVRFVQLYHWGWDTHGTSSQDDIATALPARCAETDRASAARGFTSPPLSFLAGGGPFANANSSLKAEYGWSYQVGLESGLADLVNLKGTLFRHETTNAIAIVDTAPSTAINQGDVTRQGYELEAETVPYYNLSLKLGHAYMHSKADAVSSGRANN
jgi:hypothetical protein